jgi:hypothetical protein
MLDELKERLPARAMKKMEKEAKEKSKTNPRTAAAKTASPTPTKAVSLTVDGKTQMTLF